MSVLNALPDAAWAAVVTGLFLTGQQWINTRREDRRRLADQTDRASDRAHAVAEAQRDRDHQLAVTVETLKGESTRLREVDERARLARMADHWRQERLAAHSNLLAELERALEVADGARVSVRWGADGFAVGKARAGLSEADRSSLRQQTALVELLGSSRARAVAAKCASNVLDLDVRASLASDREFMEQRVADGTYKLKYSEEAMRRTYWETRRLLVDYLNAVRAELGTEAV